MATKADIADMRTDMHKMHAEMHAGLHKMNDGLYKMNVDMHKMNAEIKTWTLATMLTIVGAMLAAILGISQIFKASTVAPVAAPSPAPIIIYAQPPAAPAGKP